MSSQQTEAKFEPVVTKCNFGPPGKDPLYICVYDIKASPNKAGEYDVTLFTRVSIPHQVYIGKSGFSIVKIVNCNYAAEARKRVLKLLINNEDDYRTRSEYDLDGVRVTAYRVKADRLAETLSILG